MIVYVSDLMVDMVLAESVKGANGRLLLPAGTKLTEQHLRIFNIWGVSEADIIEESKGEQLEADNDEILAHARDHADALFIAADMDLSPMVAFRAVCEKEYVRRLSAKQSLLELPSCSDSKQDRPQQVFRKSAEDFISNDSGLDSFPDIYYKVVKALEDPLSTAASIGDIISKDPSISVRLLSLVNSPLYGFRQPIESLPRAVVIVGAKELSMLALGVSVMDSFQEVGAKNFSRVDFWKHSLACGVFNRILSSLIPGTSQDRCFVAGMLHDFGRLVMLKLAPAEADQVFYLSNTNKIPLYKAEQEIFGFDHCQLLAVLFDLWSLPQGLAQAVTNHHGTMVNDLPVEAAICAFGDLLSVAMQYGSNGSGFVHAPCPGAWEALNLPEGALATTILTANRQIDDVLAIFLR